MNINNSLICPNCNSVNFSLKREASYMYIYKLDTPKTQERSQDHESLPFLFNNREQLSNTEYLECDNCKKQYPCEIDDSTAKVHLTILQKAIRSDHVTNPDFLG